MNHKHNDTARPLLRLSDDHDSLDVLVKLLYSDLSVADMIVALKGLKDKPELSASDLQ